MYFHYRILLKISQLIYIKKYFQYYLGKIMKFGNDISCLKKVMIK